jgi:signal transduction histidine kinase
MTMLSESHHVETFRNESDTRGSGVREDVSGPESLDMFASRVAHDLNNLLTVITSFGTFVADEIGAAQHNGCAHLANAPADIEKIRTAARRGAELTRRLLSGLEM